MGNNKETIKHTATFSLGRSTSLLEDLIAEERSGRRAEKIFKKEAWADVTQAFNRRHGEDYTIDMLKNHFFSVSFFSSTLFFFSCKADQRPHGLIYICSFRPNIVFL